MVHANNPRSTPVDTRSLIVARCGIPAAFCNGGALLSEHVVPLNDLSNWMLPPPSARDAGPIHVFDTAEVAMALLKRPSERRASYPLSRHRLDPVDDAIVVAARLTGHTAIGHQRRRTRK